MSAQPKPETEAAQATRADAVDAVCNSIIAGYSDDARAAAQAILMVDQADAARAGAGLD